jgi:hypothetical protein
MKMKKAISILGAFLLVAATATGAMAYGEQVFENSQYATSAEAGWYYIDDQNGVTDTWAIQGPDQDWSGVGAIQPGVVTYDNFLDAPDMYTSGWGGAAAGGSLVVGFDQAIVDGDGIDFMVHGFGFCFNQAFSAERGTVSIYAAESYDASSHDATDWVQLSTWQGWGDWDDNPETADTWSGNPDMNYGSSPGAYGEFLWGDLADGGLESANYLMFVLGDGGYYVDPYSGEQTNGRAFFIDSVEARTAAVPVPAAVWLLGSGLLGLVGLRRRA